MKDIARALGISIATVSRALNDSPRISSLQRKRIQEYAKEHNFYPNVIGDALYIIILRQCCLALRRKPVHVAIV